jgi:hypothetical protein
MPRVAEQTGARAIKRCRRVQSPIKLLEPRVVGCAERSLELFLNAECTPSSYSYRGISKLVRVIMSA